MRKLILWVLALCASYYLATHCDDWFYRGGRLVNHGLFTRPRYEATFSSVPLEQPGRYEYTFSYFPVRGDDSAIMLVPEGEQPVASVARLVTTISIRVVDQSNQVQCEATGTPDGTDDHVRWLVWSNGNIVLGLYHVKCARLRLHECAPCRLSIAVGPVDPRTPRIRIIPTIQGGGLELP